MFSKCRSVLIFFLYVLLINFSASQAASIDQNLFKGTRAQLIEKYQSMLNNTPNTQDFLVKRTLLSTLINIVSSKDKQYQQINQNINTKDQLAFLKLLKYIASLHLEYEFINNKLTQIDKKLKLLEESINQAKNTDKNLQILQLQYVMYILTKDKLAKRANFLSANFPKWKNLLYNLFLKVKFEPAPLKDEIEKLKVKYSKLEEKLQQLSIENDRLTLTNDIKNLNKTQKTIKNIIKSKDGIVLKIIDNYMLIYLHRIKNGKTGFSKDLNIWMGKINDKEYLALVQEENNLILYIEKRKIGNLRMFMNHSKQAAIQIISNIWDFITKPLFSIASSKISILSLFLSIVIFIIGIKVGKTYKTKVRNARLSRNIADSTKIILSNVGYYIIILITFFIALRTIGVNLSSFTVILGALSVGVGFGLQNIVSNFIAGIILMLESSIRVGDYIEISDNLRGIVKDIQIRSTTILTNDHIEVVVPNQTLFQSNVINWTLTERTRRFRIPFSVAYGTDLDRVEKIVLEALNKSDLNFVKDSSTKKPQVVMIAMNSSSVDFNLDVWVSGIDLIYPRRTSSKFLKLIYKTLYENGIAIPFPQLDVHVRDLPDT
ncbi:mechanosensitive ion channel domain-containing protein [Hippea maritima]|uniref:MscS Mechanosensitive ion channel n=1 Tax=Hippea maritima (strain ATCC 700847 / DSM 10411 / MH2) TaxID=760142 RepID=F2LWL4_HIPMA|nr:mechanosensitive ion channel domain-containing protein [Hippea maritima]AEA34123.1 MscS Mechanosensitive ion channel [Hippea maritima DSM 10411]